MREGKVGACFVGVIVLLAVHQLIIERLSENMFYKVVSADDIDQLTKFVKNLLHQG